MNVSRDRAQRGAVAVAAGLLAALSVPGVFGRGQWMLGVLAVALWWGLVAGRDWRARWGLSFVVTVMQMGVGISWFSEFSAPGFVIAVVGEAGFLSLAGLVGAGRRDRPWRFPAALVLAEAVRSAVPFGGIPLAGLDLGQVDGPLVGAARLGGRLLVVGVLAALGVAVAEMVLRRRPTEQHPIRPWSFAGPALLAVAVVVAGHAWPLGERVGEITVTAVQGGGPRGLRATESSARQVLVRHAEATEDLIDAGATASVDLIVWPEDVVDVADTITDTREGELLSDLAARAGTTLVAGVVEDEGLDQFRNAVAAWGPDGRFVGRYEKNRRVPFGEYFPFREVIDDLYEIPARDAVPGTEPGFISAPAGDLGFAISYEGFFPDRTRAAVREGAELMVIPTNAASFRGSIVPNQQVAAARLRAWEAGRDVVQVGPTGYLVFLTADGEVRFRSELGERTVATRDVVLRTGLTPYARLGDRPLVVLAALALVLAHARERRTGTAST